MAMSLRTTNSISTGVITLSYFQALPMPRFEHLGATIQGVFHDPSNPSKPIKITMDCNHAGMTFRPFGAEESTAGQPRGPALQLRHGRSTCGPEPVVAGVKM